MNVGQSAARKRQLAVKFRGHSEGSSSNRPPQWKPVHLKLRDAPH